MSHSSKLIATDIEAYLKVHEKKDLLRFLTCGSVDDGKSTLIGRLLYDSKLIYEDQMAAIEKDSKKFNTTNDAYDLALLVDGLQSEREQGITIDVAYRYFSTEKRKFIIADTPGHEQYTRNMVTGASTCDLAIVMVDARYGIQTQTRRHSYLCSLLGIKHIIVAVNKMDLVDYQRKVYQGIKAEYRKMAEDFGFTDLRFVPISALKGDNVVEASQFMDWYPGATLMKLLETVEINRESGEEPMRFPVQSVNRPNLNFRGFCGTVASGVVRVGDQIVALPSGKSSTVSQIYTYDGDLAEATQGMAITILLEDEIDISRGDMLAHPESLPALTNMYQADLVWMGETPLKVNREYLFKFTAKSCVGRVSTLEYKVDVNTLAHHSLQGTTLALNEIARVNIQLAEKIMVDSYKLLSKTGSFIVIDKLTNATVGAGMICTTLEAKSQLRLYSESELALNAYIREHFPEWECLPIGKNDTKA